MEEFGPWHPGDCGIFELGTNSFKNGSVPGRHAVVITQQRARGITKRSNDSYFFDSLFQWEGAVILEQHHALSRDFQCECAMGFTVVLAEGDVRVLDWCRRIEHSKSEACCK